MIKNWKTLLKKNTNESTQDNLLARSIDKIDLIKLVNSDETLKTLFAERQKLEREMLDAIQPKSNNSVGERKFDNEILSISQRKKEDIHWVRNKTKLVNKVNQNKESNNEWVLKRLKLKDKLVNNKSLNDFIKPNKAIFIINQRINTKVEKETFRKEAYDLKDKLGKNKKKGIGEFHKKIKSKKDKQLFNLDIIREKKDSIDNNRIDFKEKEKLDQQKKNSVDEFLKKVKSKKVERLYYSGKTREKKDSVENYRFGYKEKIELRDKKTKLDDFDKKANFNNVKTINRIGKSEIEKYPFEKKLFIFNDLAKKVQNKKREIDYFVKKSKFVKDELVKKVEKVKDYGNELKDGKKSVNDWEKTITKVNIIGKLPNTIAEKTTNLVKNNWEESREKKKEEFLLRKKLRDEFSRKFDKISDLEVLDRFSDKYFSFKEKKKEAESFDKKEKENIGEDNSIIDDNDNNENISLKEKSNREKEERKSQIKENRIRSRIEQKRVERKKEKKKDKFNY